MLYIYTNIELVLGVENMATHSTRNTTWDLANAFFFPRVSDQPLPLYKALDYVHVTRAKTVSTCMVTEKGTFNEL